MKARDNTLDIMKGIGIILVVLAHVLNKTPYSQVIYYFHMPLFFFISGLALFYSKSIHENFKKFVENKKNSILKPYLFFSVIFFIYWLIIERKIRNQINVSILSNFINIFLGRVSEELYSYNVVMWFLPCLFMTNIILYFIIKIKKEWLRIITVITLFFVGYTLNSIDVILPFGIETALISLIFVYTGYMIKQHSQQNLKITQIIFLLIISIIGLFACYMNNYEFGMLNHQYGNIFLFMLGTLSGITLIMMITSIISKYTKSLKDMLEFVGKNSITIMCVHEPIKRVIIRLTSIVFKIAEITLRTKILPSALITLVVILLTIPIIYMINKYFPFLIGKKKEKHS